MASEQGFTDEQKQYLEGFIAAIANKRGMGLPAASASGAGNPYPEDPMAIHYEAQDRAVAAGGKLVPAEVAKHKKRPFDTWDEIYVCGNAKRTARDVDRGLACIIAKQGCLDAAGAKAYLARLAREGRHLRDSLLIPHR
ncbi:MAG TPA: hypothetical protein VFQ90_15405 [Stellaceae bacterium]|jgi:hypothetical protein|nr:hypothetical protein [Stellaceae bacterium]